MKCPVCPKPDIPDDATVCPDCGVNLAPLRRVSELAPRHFNEALALAKDGKTDAALVRACSAVALDGQLVPARILLGKLLWKKGLKDEALQHWKQAGELDPANQEVQDIIRAAREETRGVARRRMLRRAIVVASVVIVAAVVLLSVAHFSEQLDSQTEELTSLNQRADVLKSQMSTYQQGHTFRNDEVATMRAAISALERREQKRQREKERRKKAVSDALAELRQIEGVIFHQKDDVALLSFSSGLFPSASDALTADAEALLSRIVGPLRAAGIPLNILVEGHTDDNPIRSSRRWADNWSLGLSRANAVLSYLNRDLDPGRFKLTACSAGESDPICLDDSGVGRARNRTVVLCITLDKERFLKGLTD